MPVTLAQRLSLSQLVDRHVDLGRAPSRANAADKMMTLVASALASGDCIDDADVLRTGGTAGAIGCAVKAPSTLGTFLRSFRRGQALRPAGSLEIKASPRLSHTTHPSSDRHHYIPSVDSDLSM